MKILKTDTTFGKVPDPEEGGTWTIYTTHPRPVASGMSGGSSLSPVIFVWTLVPDEAPASSPTDAEIARRVDLLIESCNETIVRDPSTTDFGAIQWGKFYIVMTRKDCRVWADATEDVFMRELRRVAIRQLLAERGGK